MLKKIAIGAISGLVIWLAAVGTGVQPARVASAEPIGGVDPVAGTLLQQYTFVYTGFQPNTRSPNVSAQNATWRAHW